MMLLKSHPDTINIVSKALLENKVVIIPTDTVYGFSGIVPHTDNIIRQIKGRGELKPFIQLIDDPEIIKEYSPTKIPQSILTHMPGAITVIVDNKNDNGTTAFRCPNDPWLLSILSICKRPVYTTSVNRSGQNILHAINEIEKEFSKEVYCIVDAEKKIEDPLPSTIVDIRNETISIIRQGSVIISL